MVDRSEASPGPPPNEAEDSMMISVQADEIPTPPEEIPQTPTVPPAEAPVEQDAQKVARHFLSMPCMSLTIGLQVKAAREISARSSRLMAGILGTLRSFKQESERDAAKVNPLPLLQASSS